jgi:hypothetical protein
MERRSYEGIIMTRIMRWDMNGRGRCDTKAMERKGVEVDRIKKEERRKTHIDQVNYSYYSSE